MIDLGRLSLRDSSSVVEARRKIALLAAALELDPIGAACVAAGVSALGRRLFHAQSQCAIDVAIRTVPPWSTLVLTFDAVSMGAEEAGVSALFDAVRRVERMQQRALVCEKAVPIHTEKLTPGFVGRQRALLAQRTRDELMQDMRAMNEELAAKNLKLEDFAFSTAHTLKTDWLGVAYLVEELVEIMESEGIGEGTEVRDLMNEVLSRVKRGARTVDHLLAYATMGTCIDKAPRSLLDVVKSAVALANDPRIRIAADFEDVVLLVDEAKFTTALGEIFSNAIAYGLDRPVDVSCDGKALRIRDRGRGIPKNMLVDIFGLFRRATAEGEGAGVGLAIAKQIVAAHGYRIWAESEGEGRGSTFVIEFSN